MSCCSRFTPENALEYNLEWAAPHVVRYFGSCGFCNKNLWEYFAHEDTLKDNCRIDLYDAKDLGTPSAYLSGEMYILNIIEMYKKLPRGLCTCGRTIYVT